MNLEGRAVIVTTKSIPKRVICILGMHRSGTSCLAGSLQESGLFLGEIHTWNPHNLKGNRENQQFVDLHDAILADNGGAWDNPPKDIYWSDENKARAMALLEEHGAHPVFGFKDPRALLVIDGWRELVPDMEFVGIHRHPNAVARSLEKRSGKPWEESWELWYDYNRALVQLHKKQPFPLLNFDDHEAILDEKMFHVATQMKLEGGVNEEKFYSSELKSSVDITSRKPPWKVRRLQKKLRKMCL